MIKAIAFSNVGNIRSNHEDNYLLGENQFITQQEQTQMKNNLYMNASSFCDSKGVFVVCDGMGGHSSGEVASLKSISWINKRYNLILNMNKEQLTNCMSELNQYICNCSETDANLHNMGTTLSSVIVKNDVVYFINAGDSRIFSYYNKSLIQKTIDHTEGQRLSDLGLLSADELLEFKSKKSLYKYLGRKCDLIVDVEKASYLPNCIYLICSDGLTDTLSSDEIEKIFQENNSIENIGKSLMDTALSLGEKCADNVTVILMELT